MFLFMNLNWVLIKTELQETFEDNLTKENKYNTIFFHFATDSGIGSRVLHVLSTCSTTELHASSHIWFLQEHGMY